jgi:hypothetical protein
MPESWFVRIGTEIRGPLTPAQVRALAEQGLLSPEDGISRNAFGPWIRAGRVPGLFAPPSQVGGRLMVAGGTFLEDTSAEGLATESAAEVPPIIAGMPRASPASGSLWGKEKGKSKAPRAERHLGKELQEELSPSELRESRRRQQIRLVKILSLTFLGVVAGGVALVVGVYTVRGMLAAGEAEQARRARQRGHVVPAPAIPVPENLEEVLTAVSASLAAGPAVTAAERRAGAPSVPIRWLNAATETASLGPLQVRISRVERGYARLVAEDGRIGRTRNPLLLIYVDLTLPEGCSPREVKGWASVELGAVHPILEDDTGKKWGQKVFGRLRFEGQLEKTTLEPGQTVQDLLVFDPPESQVRMLRLMLPATVVGAEGVIGFSIPGSMIADAEPGPEPSRRLRGLPPPNFSGEAGEVAADGAPKRVPGKQAETIRAEEMDQEDRIPIPGLQSDTGEVVESASGPSPPGDFSQDPRLQQLREQTLREGTGGPARRGTR